MAKQQGDGTENSIRGDVSGNAVLARDIGSLTINNVARVDIPRQLLAPDPRFTNQHELLTALEREFQAAWTELRLARIALTGRIGSGRRSVVAKAGLDHEQLFPDGTLYISLSSAERDDRLGPAATLREALAALGLPRAEIPAGLAEQAARLRTLMAPRRLLIVLTDVRGRAEIEPFLVHSPGSALVVIADEQERWVDQEAFTLLEVAGMTEPHDAELLRRLTGDRFDQADPKLVTAALAGCHGSPQLIKILAGLFHREPRRTEINLREFVELGLDALDPEDQELVAKGLRLACGRLETDAAGLFRLLGLHPAPVAGVADVLDLTGLPERSARRALDQLVRANLVTEDGEQIRLDRPVWWHARAQVKAELPEPERRSTVEEILTRCLKSTVDKDARLSRRPRINLLYQPYLSVALADRVQRAGLLAQLEQQREMLRLAVFQAEEYLLDDLTWQLCEALWGLLHVHGHYEDWLATHRAGLAAARRAANPAAIMRMLSQLGSAHFAVREYERAAAEFQEALEVAGALGGEVGLIQVQSSHEWLGKIRARLGDAEGALGYYERSWAAAFEAPAAERPRMLALLRLQRARLFVAERRFADAVRELAEPEIAGFFDTAGESDNRAKVLQVNGEALAGLADPGAAELLRQALTIFTADDSVRSMLTVLRLLVDLTGDEQYRQQIREINARLGIAD
ncbi:MULTISPECIES: tetratricopeptide repeat protein [unclassified Crossiella]|uniref:tetratricopeptide repeat protein n=1 Tax=unclassified Crossiella TaxID=2620835 RepID=UPI001FFF1E06|nr:MULTISPECIES: tetratricopeptide repeat protein [unclassified Crossiella]MCK2236603.1 tetratricopeptide repeat protein [Crossiella sp. S99.2]MCK2250270.1 tetratricopeptide repeat protein [Crossiella sp. S99.1]